jgi:biotin operon repressor
LKLADAAEEISSGLLDLTREGAAGNFMVVSCGDIYVQFAGNPGNPQVLCESISGKYLSKKLKISSAALKKKLKSLGFELGGDIETFSRSYEVITEKQARDVAKLAVKILQDAYGVAKDGEVHIELSLE